MLKMTIIVRQARIKGGIFVIFSFLCFIVQTLKSMQLCTLNSTLTLKIIFMLSLCMLLVFARTYKSMGDLWCSCNKCYNCIKSGFSRLTLLGVTKGGSAETDKTQTSTKDKFISSKIGKI